MAAGMGSRFGGLKQAAKFGNSQKVILDFAMEDAIAAGFDTAVFVIRRNIEKIFREDVSGKYENKLDVRYVFQDETQAKLPAGREKPWGTGHAVLACIDEISSPFLAINADDYYGAGAYKLVANFIDQNIEKTCALAGYKLENTLSENGGVSRGICEGDANLNLVSIAEYTGIERASDGKINSKEGRIFDGSEYTSLNFWSFPKSFMQLLGTYFDEFMSINSKSEKAEFYLPFAVDKAIKGDMSAKILPTDERWQGVTYKEDMPAVESFLKDAGRI